MQEFYVSCSGCPFVLCTTSLRPCVIQLPLVAAEVTFLGHAVSFSLQASQGNFLPKDFFQSHFYRVGLKGGQLVFQGAILASRRRKLVDDCPGFLLWICSVWFLRGHQLGIPVFWSWYKLSHEPTVFLSSLPLPVSWEQVQK